MKLKTIFESVYNEFGKLGSLEEKLSPKLKALLAAGLIGTASLGMQSCAQPTDDYDTYIVNPGDTKKGDDTKKGEDTNTEVTVPAPTDNPAPVADNTNEEKTRDNGGENTVEEKVDVTIGSETIKVTKDEAAILDREDTKKNNSINITNETLDHWVEAGAKVFIYKDNKFVPYEGAQYGKMSYYCINAAEKIVYVIPETVIVNNN